MLVFCSLTATMRINSHGETATSHGKSRLHKYKQIPHRADISLQNKIRIRFQIRYQWSGSISWKLSSDIEGRLLWMLSLAGDLKDLQFIRNKQITWGHMSEGWMWTRCGFFSRKIILSTSANPLINQQLGKKQWRVMEWPIHSPDLNPTEVMWGMWNRQDICNWRSFPGRAVKHFRRLSSETSGQSYETPTNSVFCWEPTIRAPQTKDVLTVPTE